MLCSARDDEGTAARACGLVREQLRHLRGLLQVRGRAAWEVGDVLVAAYGPPGPAVIHDGSSERLERLAEELGCSRSWLVACRATSAAWPPRVRRLSVAWAVSRGLASRPDRVVLLDRFVTACEREHVTPSASRLREFLDALDAKRVRAVGRPRSDPAAKLERMALALETESLERLIERLSAALLVRRSVATAA